MQNAQAFIIILRCFLYAFAEPQGSEESVQRQWFSPSVSRIRLRIVGRCCLVQVLYSQNTNGFHGELFENIWCRPTIGNFRVNRAVCICMSPKEASQYLGSLNTCDYHLEERTVCFISTNNGIFTH